ncbi:hypothetical protein CEXT_195101 [Caerostris extrusa]|uniref:Uncharacterized protein n=1 Tax=Caerostris extrusa TaxID=172846 RepID=A0AAV4M6D9_CAEEX|nr:hypothetical protein CEXT_195101 [Caerostris extrusa]
MVKKEKSFKKLYLKLISNSVLDTTSSIAIAILLTRFKALIVGHSYNGGKFEKRSDWRLVILLSRKRKKEARRGGGSVNGKPLFVPVVLGWPVNLWPDEILEGATPGLFLSARASLET